MMILVMGVFGSRKSSVGVTLAERSGHRRGHFIPGWLLASQLATLEVPGVDGRALVLSDDEPVAVVIAQAASWLTLDPLNDAHRMSA